MATAPIKWTECTVTEKGGLFGMPSDIKLRTAKTGRGKNAVEIWQRYYSSEMDFDGDTPEAAIKRIQEASEGVKDAHFDLDYYSEYRTLNLIGWVEETSEERIALGRAKLDADAAKKRAAVESKEAADKAQLLKLAKQYPGVLENVK